MRAPRWRSRAVQRTASSPPVTRAVTSPPSLPAAVTVLRTAALSVVPLWSARTSVPAKRCCARERVSSCRRVEGSACR